MKVLTSVCWLHVQLLDGGAAATALLAASMHLQTVHSDTGLHTHIALTAALQHSTPMSLLLRTAIIPTSGCQRCKFIIGQA